MVASTELILINRGSLTRQRYVEEILTYSIAPFIGAGAILMQDNTRTHTAIYVNKYLEETGIKKLIGHVRLAG